jgi:hypothetical protein
MRLDPDIPARRLPGRVPGTCNRKALRLKIPTS